MKKIMKQKKSWAVITRYGRYFNQKIKNLANKYELKIDIIGIESITSFNFLSKKNIEYKTFISQEMLKKNYLASNQIFITIHHNKKIIDEYINKLDPVFKNISYFEKNNINSKNFLKDKVCHQTFQRLNA